MGALRLGTNGWAEGLRLLLMVGILGRVVGLRLGRSVATREGRAFFGNDGKCQEHLEAGTECQPKFTGRGPIA